ncbi:MAG: GFA family protein [Alphaproteobacteria bacterium]|jgi:hypothetical protein|nr:GFA family protein [Alphaproteobacteria bacterium]
MNIEGSCLCGNVRFSAVSPAPYPYRICYCRRCRKTGGGGGTGANIMAKNASLVVEGRESLGTYVSASNPPGPGIPPVELEMNFCRTCGSQLFIYSRSEGWSDWVYPWASAIDTDLPNPPDWYHINLGAKASWVDAPVGSEHAHFIENTPESIEKWHKDRGLWEES